METVTQLFQQHPYWMSVVSTWVFNNIVTALISNLPAPTKDSSSKYVYWFKVMNTVIGNLARAQATSIENSPNFQDALKNHVDLMTRLQDNKPQ